jgi:hypothetical protein
VKLPIITILCDFGNSLEKTCWDWWKKACLNSGGTVEKWFSIRLPVWNNPYAMARPSQCQMPFCTHAEYEAGLHHGADGI